MRREELYRVRNCMCKGVAEVSTDRKGFVWPPAWAQWGCPAGCMTERSRDRVGSICLPVFSEFSLSAFLPFLFPFPLSHHQGARVVGEVAGVDGEEEDFRILA